MAAEKQYGNEKQNLLKHLLDSVKQCQIRFGGKTELATELDSRVSCLCSAWENILQHGMKHAKKTLSALKQMTEMTGLSKIGFLEDVKNMETEPAFWQYVLQHLNPHESQRYYRLIHVTSDAGRGRAWLRSALNEHALERYVHMLIMDDNLLSAFYEDWAFLRDNERQHVLPNAAAGLKSVLFAINIDRAELNTIRPARGLDELVSSAAGVLSSSPPPGSSGLQFDAANYGELRPVIGAVDEGKRKATKKVKKKVPKIVSFDEGISESGHSVSTPWAAGGSLQKAGLTSVSLPCTPRLPAGASSRFDSFSVGSYASTGSDSARSYASAESSGGVSLKTEETHDSYRINVGQEMVRSKTHSRDTDRDSTSSEAHSYDAKSGHDTHSGNNSGLSNEKSDSEQSRGKPSHSINEQSNITNSTSHTDSSMPANPSYSGLARMFRTASKSSLDSVTSAKSSRSEQSFAVTEVMQKTEHTKGHKKSHSDTSMFSDLGSRIIKTVMTVSKRKLSTEDVQNISSQSNAPFSLTEVSPEREIDKNAATGQSTGGNVAFSLSHSASVGSFDNVSMTDIPTNGNGQEKSDIGKQITGANKSSIGNETLRNDKPQYTKMVSGIVKYSDEKNTHKPLRQSFSTGALPKEHKHNSLTENFSSTYNQDDDGGLVPLGEDGHVLPGVLLRPEVSDNRQTLSSSPGDFLANSSDHSASGGHYFWEGSAHEQASLAMALAQHSLSASETQRTQGDGSHYPPAPPGGSSSSDMNQPDGMTTAELKEAIIAMMKRKDEVEEENRYVRIALDGELEVSNTLRLELGETKKAYQSQQEWQNSKIQALSRENELLKHQLRKYVSAVQMLRRQGATENDFPGLHMEDVQPAVPPLSINTDFIQEAADYEKKLIQVAEMHGELMEFNEHLHRQLVSRDALIKDMRAELTDLRGPLPENMPSADDDWSIISGVSDGGAGRRALVNVWIPAAFLKGKSAHSYHVYQVYVRIRDEEWNVYRRYSEFSELHNFLKKRNPVVNTFAFPKKKAIGNKDEKFVEQRRRDLQTYMRRVINLIAQINTSLQVDINRAKLSRTVPFFGDASVVEKKSSRNRASSGSAASADNRRQNSSTASPRQQEPQYSGL